MIDTHRGLEPRIIAFYFLMAFLLLVLAGGLAYRQLLQTGLYDKSERQQTQRRILLPGPRGNIYDRNHKLLVGNRPRFTAVLYLDELQNEFRAEGMRIRANYKSSGANDVTWGQLEEIARVSVVQRYQDMANAILRRNQPLDTKELKAHFFRQLLVPYPLFEDLTPDEFARLLENLPVKSPLQLYVGNARTYPYGSAASHVLGYVQSEDNVLADGFPGDDLTTLKLRGTAGATGLEKKFDAQLQGKSGGAIYRVDPTGYKVNPPLDQRMPQQGTDLITSLDIQVQQAAEEVIGDQIGSAAAVDIRTGEVLALVSKPDYDLNHFPHERAAYIDAEKRGALNDASYAGRYTPGSTFKILVSIAGLRSGRLDPEDDSIDCEYTTRIGNRSFGCDSGKEAHGRLKLPEAIADSCDIYFYHHGIEIGPQVILDEGAPDALGRPHRHRAALGSTQPAARSRPTGILDSRRHRRNLHRPGRDHGNAAQHGVLSLLVCAQRSLDAAHDLARSQSGDPTHRADRADCPAARDHPARTERSDHPRRRHRP